MSKKVRIGRPPGPYAGGYKPPHLRKEQISLRLPAWMHKLVRSKDINFSQYVEKLILNDTGWKEPKK